MARQVVGRRRFVFSILVLALLATTVLAQQGAKNGEWRIYGGDTGSTRYAPLDQINRDNVKNLRVAWIWRSENFGTGLEYKSETTPLMVNGVLYFPVGNRRSIVAADAGTGETLWVWRIDEGSRLNGVRRNNRGVAYWTDGREERIITVTPGYQLVALNAKTGQQIPTFGKDGIVDLTLQVEKDANYNTDIGHLMNTSPPMVSHDVVVIPTSLENARAPKSMKYPKGDIMAFDVRTGKKLWSFHTVPRPGEFGADTWENNSNVYSGHTGAWPPFSVDEELGYLYLPVEGATGDEYGGHRHGNNLFSSSIVCLDIKTGKRIWHQQLIHHDVWDYDPPTAPILTDLNVGGRAIKAVVQLTKTSFAYTFDRRTGNPVWPIEERPVPQSDAPGEKTSPTQPFPTKPPPFDRQGLSADDLIDFTPQLKQMALQAIEGYRIGPMFTPPSVADRARGTKGTLTFPGSGGANWEGGAFDPETGFLYIGSATRTDTSVYALTTPQPGQTDFQMIALGGVGPNIQGLPFIKPPFGRITAIDMNRGEIAWQMANGDTPPAIRDHPLLKGVNLPRTGSESRAGILITKTLMFAGEGYGGQPMFRAHDKRTGQIIWETKLPYGPQSGLPITYMHRGKQYIVFAASGVPATQTAGQLIAFAIPDSPSGAARPADPDK
jgi:quinoprotein glucose dehydrogenase